MTHAHLQRLVSYLGLRGCRRQNSPIFRMQVVKTLWQPRDYTTRNKRNQEAPFQMGQTTSFIRAYTGANGKDSEAEPKGRIDKGLKGLDTDDESISKNDSAKVSSENEVEQKVSADVLAKAVDAEKILETAEVSMTNGLEKKIEKDLVSESTEPAAVVIEEPVKSQTALNLALDELGEPPERPLPGDCCGQGCDVCVWDTYNDELRDYLVRKKALLKQSK